MKSLHLPLVVYRPHGAAGVTVTLWLYSNNTLKIQGMTENPVYLTHLYPVTIDNVAREMAYLYKFLEQIH